MYYVTALGEILIDFTTSLRSDQGNYCFEQNPGGAPANVLSCIAKLGGKTAFIGKVGRDMFGNFLLQVLTEYGVDTSGLKFSDSYNTTLAFVKLDENGDRSFIFYRNPGADTSLTSSEINFELINQSKVFHFGSLSMTDEPSKSATLKALEHAKDNNLIISYDPNLRPALWKSLDHALNEIKSVLNRVDILKVSEEELEFITGVKDLAEGSSILYDQYRINVILVTRGSNGCFYRHKGVTGGKPAFKNLKTIDTTGAGDAFLGGILYFLLSKGICQVNELDISLLESSIIFANAVAAICTTRRGAIPAMPDISEVNDLINGVI
ncbi:carbohydrate kinase family protein [Acetivibrio cellulolyticus]|uniref:carbohydrate kinase family protein n=1 Tax=Acetivibrio cellulolyticus TaxID=35830 RepID=UPI0001E2C311|nr:carbohydrate kinase [Acetivibrio cellulolyticus]